ncbi:WxL domain-containing protein [Enterococcus sp. S22(2020)]|nr:WxL domain-containing protein [Enterococcus sp. S23]MCA5015283.1 WxL domain-containing protein [Enterococcus sp. S22(2020)]
MSKNLNFLISFSMYNMSNTPKKFALIDHTDTDYRSDKVSIYPLANNEGFSFSPDNINRFTVKLKKNGEWLSDYQKYKTADFTRSSNVPLFGLDASGTGHEIEKHDNLDIPLVSGVDSMFQLGTPAKMVAPGEAVVGAYEMFVGNEIPYMGLEITTQNSYDIYNNHPTRTLTNNYKLTKIQAKPTGPSKGNIHVSYPNGEDTTVPFVADAAKEAVGNFDIQLDKLPNDDVGTIKENTIGVLGIIEGEADNPYDGLPSNDGFVTVNVYNFGGTGQLQHVLQNSAWTKDAKELIVDPVALPNHTISYEYEEGKVPDTSKIGLQWVGVRMTDNMDKTQSKVIQVPVLVEKGPLSKGLWLTADDIYLVPEEIRGLTSAQIKQLILTKSKAYGVDLSTKLSDGVILDVTNTDLTGRPAAEKYVFTATIQASKEGNIPITKDIKIYFVSDPMINDPIIFASKQEIKLGESNQFISIFQDILSPATKLLDVQYKSAAFPEYVTPNKESVKVVVDGATLPIHSSGIDFTSDRKLKITIPEIPAGALVEVYYDVTTAIGVKPPAYPTTVSQSYTLTGKRADGITFDEVGIQMPASFNINKPTSTIQIKYLMEGTNTPIPNNYPATMSGNIDDESDLINIDLDNYVLSKVQYDGVDQPIPTKAFKVKYGAVEIITFYYKGVLKIKSAPNTIDFGSKKVSARSEEYDDSTYDQPLVIWDNRLSLTEWKVTLKQSDDMKLSGEAEQRLAGALRYKMADEEKILSKDSQEVFRSAHQTSGEYDVSKTWGPNKQGLRLKVPVGMVKQTGTYETTLTWRIEETY